MKVIWTVLYFLLWHKLNIWINLWFFFKCSPNIFHTCYNIKYCQCDKYILITKHFEKKNWEWQKILTESREGRGKWSVKHNPFLNRFYLISIFCHYCPLRIFLFALNKAIRIFAQYNYWYHLYHSDTMFTNVS